MDIGAKHTTKDLIATCAATRICVFNFSEQEVNDLLILHMISLKLISFMLSFLLCMCVHMAETFWDMSVARGVLRVLSVQIKLCGSLNLLLIF